MVSVMEAARYFVSLSYGRNKYSLTPLKLQKLLYLAQGWSYVWDGFPAFPDEFVAWQYGPVNEEVYEFFKKYGRQEIPEYEGCNFISDNDVQGTLVAVWNEYGKSSAYDLVELTHRQKPWMDAYSHHRTITNNSIRDYFQSTF